MTLPDDFVKSMRDIGLAELPDVLMSTEPETSVRVNASRAISRPDGATPVDWCDTGFYLDRRPAFTFDPALHQGLYYVQDASSMAVRDVIASLTAGHGPLRLLDACAAPGGKTTAAIDALPAGSLVVANEFDRKRAPILAENIAKWGSPAVIVSRGDTARLGRLRDTFDIVIADVPCSGEGMMRKDPDAVSQWSPRLVADCAALQRDIVENLWPALRPGGIMLYSTCTFNRTENEENIDWICRTLGARTMPLPLADYPAISRGIDTPRDCYRFIPGRTRGEGLFMCALVKDGEPVAERPGRAKKARTKGGDRKTQTPGIPASWTNGEYETYADGDTLSLLPAALADDMRLIASALDCLSVGVEAATVKGRDLIPSQALALSSALAPDAFPRADVDYSTALAYLRREAVTLPDAAPRGIVLLTYAGRPLGFVKNLGTRANNLYPSPWRILSTATPSTPPQILG